MIVLQSSNLQKVSRWNLLVHCSPTKKFHLGLSICLPKLAGVEWGMGALELDGVGRSRRKFATRSQSDSAWLVQTAMERWLKGFKLWEH
jgi:hypothetical protein